MSVRTAMDALVSIDRLGAFVSSGFAGAAVDVTTMYLLVEFLALDPVLAKVFTWELTVGVIFVLNERWAFGSIGDDDRWSLLGRFVRSNVVRFGGFIVTLVALAVLVHDLHVWYVFANILAIWIGFVVNYVFECFYTWKVHLE